MVNRQKVKSGISGFSLVELMFVMAIIGILAGIAVPSFLNARTKAHQGLAVGDINVIAKAIWAYYAANGEFPCNLSELGLTDIRDPWGNEYQYLNFTCDDKGKDKGKDNGKGKGKDDGKGKGKGNDKPDGGVGKMRKDRFMVPINTYFDLYSMGADGKSSTPLTAQISQDDLIYANDGGYVGLASDY